MAKNLLRISLFQVAFIRSLFPSGHFQDRTLFGDLGVKVLNPKCKTSRRLIDWLEKGVTEALYKEYLKCLRFGISSDKQGKNLIEEYVFNFAYQEDGEIRLQILNSIKKSPVNTLATDSVKQLKGQVCKMTRLLVALTASFDPLPDEKYVSVHLEYYDTRTPDKYEPPFFTAARELPGFQQRPFSMGLGACQTKHVCIGMKAKTTAVSDLDQGYEYSGNHNSETTHAQERMPAMGIQPSQMPNDDFSSLGTAFDHVQLGASQPEETMNLVRELVSERENASQWTASKLNYSLSYDDTASEFQCLENADAERAEKNGAECKSQEPDESLAWDCIPASQQDNTRKKKFSRGVLDGAAPGPSKRMRRMRED